MGFLFVALGGAVGAMGRYAIGLLSVRTGFPILTLLVNILGAACCLAGIFLGKSCPCWSADSLRPRAAKRDLRWNHGVK